jgi:uncharacterized protein (TIGR03083 family)
MSIDYLRHIRDESARFGEVLRAVDPAARVPSCPDWSAADLLWHLTKVQQFWATIVRDRLDAPPADEPERPVGHAELLAAFDAAGAALVGALADTGDDVAVWTWSDDRTAGFVRRRQAHEALIHRLDAELAADAVTDFDPELAADGVDEALRVMFSGPSWGTFRADGPTGRLEVAGGHGAWTFRTGTFTGTAPESGTTYTDEPAVEMLGDDVAATFTISGSARDLDAFLWNRPTVSELQIDGERTDYERFVTVVRTGIE